MTTLEAPLASIRAGISDARFRAMGSAAHVLVVGGRPRLVTGAEPHIARLERSWSRFRPDSELNLLNAAAGRDVEISDDLSIALRRALDAWSLTDGAYDPTVLHAIEAAGYDRSFELLRDAGDVGACATVPGCAEIVLDLYLRTAYLPDGVGIDLGGIGKGLAADLVVAELFRLGADGALVNIGGDVRVAGTPVGPDGWVVEIEDPFRPHERGVCVAIADGAVATSTRLEKTWRRGTARMHHLIDPATGKPIETELVSVSIVAGEAWWAEALTKAVFVLGVEAGRDILEAHGVHGLFFLEDGGSVVAGDWRQILA
jgi:thiamine biosynthesis lipoprotein